MKLQSKIVQLPRGFNKGGFKEICPSITINAWQENNFVSIGGMNKITQDKLYDGKYRIRKLTPKETIKLMGFDDEDYEKASKVNSNTQLYKAAGNSIVVPVLEGIFTNMFKDRLEHT